MIARSIVLMTALSLAVTAMGHSSPQTLVQNSPEVQVGQSIADIFKSASGADIAFVASGFLAQTTNTRNLATSFQFPSDELWLVSLTGKQLEVAFEHSLAFYPEPCPDMLYLSGAEVTFQSNKATKAKFMSATIGGISIDSAKTYKVAMPASLARGGLSYFAVWNFQKAEKVISPSISKLLDGKSVQTSTLRWLSRQSL
jgi:2',3'-cyclic-nucleotide 2'-phosphodiesterase (5'-nucleotidase family)